MAVREFGVNADPSHWSDLPQLARDIAATGCGWVRTVVPSGSDLTPWIDACHAVGLKVLGVIARESLTDWEASWSEGSYLVFADGYAQVYDGHLDALQVGNEPDQVADSSWSMTPTQLNQMLRAFQAAFTHLPLIGPGLTSGQPYLYNFALVDAQAAHPYVDPETLRSVGLRSPSNGQPYWITEYPASEGMSLAMAEQSAWSVAFAFCWSDLMIGTLGLLQADGQPNPEYDGFLAAVKNPSPTKEESMARIEDFLPKHPLWAPDKDPSYDPRIRILGDGVRLAGTANHALLEIDGYVWALPNDDAFFQ